MSDSEDEQIVWQGRFITAKTRGKWEYVSRARGIKAAVILAVDDGDVLLVEQVDVLERPVVALQHLHVVGLDLRGLLHDPVVRARDLLGEEPVPLAVGERDLVQGLQLDAQVRHQVNLGMQRKVLVRLLHQQREEGLLQVCFALVGRLRCGLGDELGHHGALSTQCDRLEHHPRTDAPRHDTASSNVNRRSR